MNDLNHLLDRAADGAPTGDVLADLTRGRTALRRRRARLLGRGVAGLGVATLVAVVVVQGAANEARQPSARATESQSTTESGPAAVGIRLVSKTLVAGPYTFGATPVGWEFQGQSEYAALIAPTSGSVSPRLDVFVGKIAILLESGPLPADPMLPQETLTHDGRTFHVWDGGGDVTIVSTPTRPEEPGARVVAQFPSGTDWDRKSMAEFLGSVRVGPGAQASVG